jgi:hypothetical protein
MKELTITAASNLLIGLIGGTGFVFFAALDAKGESVWPSSSGHHLFTVAIVGSCAVIALLAGYVQKARSLEKVSHRVEAVTFGLE